MQADRPSTVRAYLQLMRIPNVFTAIADVVMAYCFTYQLHYEGIVSWSPDILSLASLIGASSCLYTAGMILNDFFDLPYDSRLRPERPIPSGRISRRFAGVWGFGLLIVGTGCGLAAVLRNAHYLDRDLTIVAGSLPIVLAMAIVLYDAGMKRTWFGPVNMGACRTLNVLFGMSLNQPTWRRFHDIFTPACWGVAVGIGIYIVGVTWLARREAERSRRAMLAGATFVMISGLALIGIFPWLREAPELRLSRGLWPLLLLLLMMPVVWRCLRAIYQPTNPRVQVAVKTSILSLILLDAAILGAVQGPAVSLFVALLLVPSLWLGRFIYST